MRRLLWIILIIGMLSFVPPAFGYPVLWGNMETGPSFLQDKVESTVAWTSFSADVVKDTRSSASLGYSSLYWDFSGGFDVSSGPQATPLSTSLSSGEGTLTPVPKTGTERSSEDVQELAINETDLSVLILLNSTYSPGDPIRVDFFITNKVGTVKEIEIGLDIYYFGIKVFSYEHPSWREYGEGKTVHIFQESRLPIITPPGKYTFKFYITPAGKETNEISTSITVKPNAAWILFLMASLGLLGGVLIIIRKYWNWIVKTYREFSTGQKFVFFAIIGLITAAVILALGAENYANDVAILVYYLLLIGVLNEWIEYLKPRWDRKNLRTVLSVYLLAFLMYLSWDTFTIYLPVLIFLLGTAVGMVNIKSGKEKKPQSKGTILTEVEIVGETKEGFIIYREKGEFDERED